MQAEGVRAVTTPHPENTLSLWRRHVTPMGPFHPPVVMWDRVTPLGVQLAVVDLRDGVAHDGNTSVYGATIHCWAEHAAADSFSGPTGLRNALGWCDRLLMMAGYRFDQSFAPIGKGKGDQ